MSRVSALSRTMERKAIFRVIRYTIFVGIATWAFLAFIAQKELVDGNSMLPSYKNGDIIWVNKFAYKIHDPERFDVIVFSLEGYEGTYLIKRIVGLPGETVMIDEEGVIYINGTPIEDKSGLKLEQISDPGLALHAIKLSENEYFVLGDNRNDSVDSRFELVGNVKKEAIVGKIREKSTKLSGTVK